MPIVDLPALRNALAEVPSARLALVVSDAWFKAVVRHDPGAVDHRDYTRVPVSVKELDDWAWIHVPGRPNADVSSSPNRAYAPETQAAGGAAHGGTTTLNFFSRVRADTIVGHDQTNHRTGAVHPRQDRQ